MLVLSVTDFGAVGDGIVLSDISITNGSNILSSPSHAFTSADIGKKVALYSAGTSGFGLSTIIQNVSGAKAILEAHAVRTVSSGLAQICTDDTTAFMAARGFLITQNPLQYTLIIPPGIYWIGTDKWLKGITNVKVSAYGASFIAATTNNTHGIDNSGLSFGGDIFSDQGYGFFDPSTNQNGNLIQSAAVGANSVTLTNSADAGSFAVGDDVLVYGFDSQGVASYPPNPKYFEYTTVTAINPGTGVISVSDPLRHAYNSSWYDAAATYDVICGAPRLLSLKRRNMRVAQNVRFEGGTFLAWYGAHSSSSRRYAGTIFPAGARNITLVDVNATGFVISEVENVSFIGGAYQPDTLGSGFIEADKIVDTATFENVTLSGFTQATGVNDTIFRNCLLLGQFQNFSRNQVYEGNDFKTDTSLNADHLMTNGSTYYVQSLTYTDNTFHVKAGMVGISNVPFPVNMTVTLDPTAKSFSVPFSSSITRALEVGQILTCGSKSFIVSDFVCNPAGQCTINGASSGGSPAAGDVYSSSSPGTRISDSNVFVSTTDIINVVPSTTSPVFDASLGNIQKLTLTAGNVASGEAQLVNAEVGQVLQFIIVQDSVAHSFAWPSNVSGGTIGTKPKMCTFQWCTCDGTTASNVKNGVDQPADTG